MQLCFASMPGNVQGILRPVQSGAFYTAHDHHTATHPACPERDQRLLVRHARRERPRHQPGRPLGWDIVSWAADQLLAALLLITVVAVAFDRIAGARFEAGYWVAIIAMRAAATNPADFMTHDLALGYVTVSFLLAGLTLIAARFTHPDLARGGSPRVDGAYWIAMFIAGLFGTAAGDLIHHTIGLYAATSVLCLALAGLIGLRDAFSPVSVVLYWAIIMAERCAGTAVGDMLVSGRAIALGGACSVRLYRRTDPTVTVASGLAWEAAGNTELTPIDIALTAARRRRRFRLLRKLRRKQVEQAAPKVGHGRAGGQVSNNR